MIISVALAATLAGYLAQLWLLPVVTTQEDPAQVLLAAELSAPNGSKQALTQWQGKVIVVNFWATWCPPCLKEIPDFMTVQNQLGARGVQMVGIAIDDKDKVLAFMAKLGMNYPVLFAEDGITLARRSGNRLGGLPFTVIIDRAGKTTKVELGTLDAARLTRLVEPLL
jgi:thiol-disulfide isomerase/thioredoxin